MENLSFVKMHGLGNDFIIIDSRDLDFRPKPNEIKCLSNRRLGIGCDQLVLIKNSEDGIADFQILIFNSDGSEAESCGNATRCVGKLLLKESKTKNVIIETKGGLVDIEELKNGMISVDMGVAKFNWDEIPLSHPMDTRNLGIKLKNLNEGFSVSLGNPHVVFFCDQIDRINMKEECIKVSKMKIFPAGINVNIAMVKSRKLIELQVYERGSGFTDACGTGACATLIAAYNKNLTDRNSIIRMRGGDLEISFLSDNHILMTGPVSEVYKGLVNLKDLRVNIK